MYIAQHFGYNISLDFISLREKKITVYFFSDFFHFHFLIHQQKSFSNQSPAVSYNLVLGTLRLKSCAYYSQTWSRYKMIFKAHRLYFVSISGALQYARFILFMVHKRGKQVSKEKSFCNENWLAIEFCTSAVISNSQKDWWMKKKKSCQTHLKKLFCVVPLSMILMMMLMMLLMMLMTQDVGWLLKWRAMGTDATSWRHLPTNHIDQQTSSTLSQGPPKKPKSWQSSSNWGCFVILWRTWVLHLYCLYVTMHHTNDDGNNQWKWARDAFVFVLALAVIPVPTPRGLPPPTLAWQGTITIRGIAQLQIDTSFSKTCSIDPFSLIV